MCVVWGERDRDSGCKRSGGGPALGVGRHERFSPQSLASVDEPLVWMGVDGERSRWDS